MMKFAQSLYLVHRAWLFSCLCILCLSGWVQAAETGSGLLKKSIRTLSTVRTIECNIRMNLLIGDEVFSARGRYEEQALLRVSTPFQRTMFRQDLNFLMNTPSSPGSEPNRMIIVCHSSENRERGEAWTYKSIEGTKTLHRIKLALLEDAIRQANRSSDFPAVAEVVRLGGLAGMLKQISQIYQLNEAAELCEFDEDSKQRVWKVSGKLKQDQQEFLLSQLGGTNKKNQYPKELPTDVILYLDPENGFPRKVCYLNRTVDHVAPETVLTETTYFDVILNGEEIPESRFASFGSDKGEYPEGVFGFQDITADFIRSLGLPYSGVGGEEAQSF